MKNKITLFTFIFLALIAVVLMKNFSAVKTDSDWLQYGKDYSHSKFSGLEEINVNTVSKLKEIWSFEDDRDGSSIFFNPLIVNGKMITFMPSKRVVCIDAKARMA